MYIPSVRGRPDGWEGSPSQDKDAAKQDRKEAIGELIDDQMQTWIEQNSRENGDYATLADHTLGDPAWHMDNGTKDQVGLMITARAGACLLRGNKTRDRKTQVEETLCPHCNQREPETETQ